MFLNYLWTSPVTEGYMVLHCVTEGYSVLMWVTEGYSGLMWVTAGYSAITTMQAQILFVEKPKIGLPEMFALKNNFGPNPLA